jgi:hypothetical protein
MLAAHSRITPATTDHMIGLDVDPFVPKGWAVEEHRKIGPLFWDASKTALYRSKEQQHGESIEGNKLRQELKEVPVYNANVLDCLLKNQRLIPEAWKGPFVMFWGTIYRDSDDLLCVRCLCWCGWFGWDWSVIQLDRDWPHYYPAAVPAD